MIIGLTNRQETAAVRRFTELCLEDSGISFHNLYSFSRTGLELHADKDNFVFLYGVLFCGDHDKTRQAALFLNSNLMLGRITPIESLHLALWDNQVSVAKRFLETQEFSKFGLAKNVSKQVVCMGLEDLIEKSVANINWDPQTAIDFINLKL